jgi:hypothetical protein
MLSPIVPAVELQAGLPQGQLAMPEGGWGIAPHAGALRRGGIVFDPVADLIKGMFIIRHLLPSGGFSEMAEAKYSWRSVWPATFATPATATSPLGTTAMASSSPSTGGTGSNPSSGQISRPRRRDS